MRLLMVGPAQMAAMRRQIDWAVESGIEVLVANVRRSGSGYVPLPPAVRQAALLPERAHGRARLHRKSQRAAQVGALRLRALAAQFQPDIVHSYALSHFTDMCLQAELRPLVISVWGFMNRWLTGRVTPTDRRWLRRLRMGAHTLLVENPNFEQALAGQSLAPLRVECFPIGVDSRLFHPDLVEKAAAWRFALDIPAGATVLLSPRGWSKIYGQSFIMQAFAAAYQRLNKPLVLVLMGMGRMRRPEALAQEVHDLGVSLGVGHAIRWIPAVAHQDMPGVYALADIVVNYPNVDAFPSTLLEAAACARPVITSDLPAYRNTFVERFCRLVEPANPAALADAIVAMVAEGPAAWAAPVQAARQAVLAEHEESDQKQKLLALYQQIAAESKRRT